MPVWTIMQRVERSRVAVDRCLLGAPDWFEREAGKWNVSNMARLESGYEDAPSVFVETFDPPPVEPELRVYSRYRQQTRVFVETLSEADLAELMKQPRRCKGACRKLLTHAEFEISREKGHRVFRDKCRECMKAYYRSLRMPPDARVRAAKIIVDAGKPLDAREIAKRMRTKRVLVVRMLRHSWFVREHGTYAISDLGRKRILEQAVRLQGGSASRSKAQQPLEDRR